MAAGPIFFPRSRFPALRRGRFSPADIDAILLLAADLERLDGREREVIVYGGGTAVAIAERSLAIGGTRRILFERPLLGRQWPGRAFGYRAYVPALDAGHGTSCSHFRDLLAALPRPEWIAAWRPPAEGAETDADHPCAPPRGQSAGKQAEGW